MELTTWKNANIKLNFTEFTKVISNIKVDLKPFNYKCRKGLTLWGLLFKKNYSCDIIRWRIVLYFPEKHHYWNCKETASWYCWSFSLLKIFSVLLGMVFLYKFSKKSEKIWKFYLPLLFADPPTKTAKWFFLNSFWNCQTFVALLAYQ